MCHGNTNKDKRRYGMGDFDHEIIHVTVDISKELQHKSVQTGLSTGLSTKLCFDFTFLKQISTSAWRATTHAQLMKIV